MNLESKKRIVAFVSSYLADSISIIKELENSGFDVRHCRNAKEAILLFILPVDIRPNLIITDSFIFNPHWNLSEIQMEMNIGNSPGVEMIKYIWKLFNPSLHAIVYTNDVYEFEELKAVEEYRTKLKMILLSGHLKDDILKSAVNDFPKKRIHVFVETTRNTATIRHYKRKIIKRRIAQLSKEMS
jgi:hypothetical protein